MALLINGNGFSPVTAQEDADLYAGLVGQSLTVLNVGNNMAYSIQSATCVRILDGEAVCQGRRIHLDPGTYDDFTIPSGSSGVTSYYIIGYHIYTDGSGNELAETFVEQMSSASDTVSEAVLRDGATETYVSFYRVTVSGLTISSVTALYDYVHDNTNKMIQGGKVYITPSAANTPTYVEVEYDHAFANLPVVVATPITDSPGTYLTGCSVTNATRTSCRIFITRTNTIQTPVMWMAFDPTTI